MTRKFQWCYIGQNNRGTSMNLERTLMNGMVVYRGTVYVPAVKFDYTVLDRRSLTFEHRAGELYYLPTDEEKELTDLTVDKIKFKEM